MGEEEKVTNISEPNENDDAPINTEDPVLRPKLRKNALEENVDPVKIQKKKETEPKKVIPCTCKDSIHIEPTISTRKRYKFPSQAGVCDDFAVVKPEPKPVYEYPPTKKFLELQEKNKTDTAAKEFCEWTQVKVDKPLPKRKIDIEIDVPSPEPSQAKVPFRKTSPSPSLLYPDPQTDEELGDKKPKSGYFINESEKDPVTGLPMYDSFDLVYQGKARPPWPDRHSLKKGKKKSRGKSGDGLGDIDEGDESGERRRKGKGRKKKRKKSVTVDKSDLDQMPEPENVLTKMLRKTVSVTSAATSYNSEDIPPTEVQTESPAIHKILQKFRRESEMKRYGPQRRKFKRGTLQSHSFTDICQPTLRDFFFGSKEGTMHQGDENISERIRDFQGVCMPVAAFCYSIIKHPNKWTRETIDEILVYGNNLLHQSLDEAHIHKLKKDVKMDVLKKYMTIGDKKFRFHIDDPDIAGYIRSDDKIIYNLTKALGIFFHRHTAGILHTKNLNIGIWKQKYIYMFDAKPRTKDLYCSPTGAAVMAVFYDVPSLATVFLTRSNFGNWPFEIHPLKVYRIIGISDAEIDSKTALDVRSEYNILNENKAVVLGSFDLGDKCFDFSRYKQALTMAVISLVYSRLTPPSAWHRKTVDKILILGNLLYRECLCCSTTEEVKLENIPAIFTIGPYIVEIYIFGNVYADVIYRSCVCQLQSCMELFLTKCTNGILQIGKCHLAIWKQRNMFYCFDPYSRNNEGYMTRDGCACVSMHSTMESLIETIVHNFDKDTIFYIHALKVCKIHRDPVQSTSFPKHVAMDDFPLDCFKNYKMKKSKKGATEKPVTVDYSAIAMRRLLAGESPHASIMEIGSNVGSIGMDQLNALMKKCPSKPCVALHPIPRDDIADLDSPSLEDTQIEPPLPQQSALDEEIEFMDLDSFGPTMDELEMEGEGSVEDFGEYQADVEGLCMDEPEGEGFLGGDGEGGWYYGKDAYSQFDLDAGLKVSEEVNTDITYFPIKRDILYPTYMRGKMEMKYRLQKYKFRDEDWEHYLPPCPPTVTKSEELRISTNFIDLPDDTQIIVGTKNVAQLGQTVEYIAPFVCIMANVVAKKYNILTWTGEIIDYILKCGNELYGASKFRYDQVSKLEIPRITLGANVYTVLVEYVFDSYTRQNILELALDKILFVRSDTGVIVTPTYACAVMFKNHLYYLYDPFGNNELGLSEGVGEKGVAAFVRFKDLHSLTTRIMFNKQKRESAEEIVYSRFVLSSVKVKGVYDFGDAGAPKKKKEPIEPGEDMEGYNEEEEGAPEEEKPKPENRVGYHYENKHWLLCGTKNLGDREIISSNLKEDHFVCICACLMLLTTSVEKWTTKKVDLAIDYGVHVYSHADDLYISEKRTIKNILIGKNFFDVIIRVLEIENWQANKDLATGLDTLFSRKFTYFMIQFANACYVVHKSSDGNYHIFDPYGIMEEKPAGWMKCENVKDLKKELKAKIIAGGETYKFYNFQVTHIEKAPKSVILSHKLQSFEMKPKPPKKEKYGKPFYEDAEWLKMDPIAWSRMSQRAANGKIRGTIENLWYSWDEEYPKDLWSLLGNINQRNERFAQTSRGKQTLANLITGIGMTSIYELAEWNSAVVDSVLVNGENYFVECTQNISDEDYELAMDDLLPDCSIFPFSFKVEWKPVVEGTMFASCRPGQYNLFKALRFFFTNVDSRLGVIMLTKTTLKRQIAFGKLKDSEYFVFDCDCRGTPMFVEGQDVAYILRMTTLNRLLHVLTLTLRGGDFYIYDVKISEMKPLS